MEIQINLEAVEVQIVPEKTVRPVRHRETKTTRARHPRRQCRSFVLTMTRNNKNNNRVCFVPVLVVGHCGQNPTGLGAPNTFWRRDKRELARDTPRPQTNGGRGRGICIVLQVMVRNWEGRRLLIVMLIFCLLFFCTGVFRLCQFFLFRIASRLMHGLF